MKGKVGGKDGVLVDDTKNRMHEDEMRKRRKADELSSEVSSQLGKATVLHFKCDTCQRTFRHRQDNARCATTRPKVQVTSKLPVFSFI